jgi:hypothetical protein
LCFPEEKKQSILNLLSTRISPEVDNIGELGVFGLQGLHVFFKGLQPNLYRCKNDFKPF